MDSKSQASAYRISGFPFSYIKMINFIGPYVKNMWGLISELIFFLRKCQNSDIFLILLTFIFSKFTFFLFKIQKNLSLIKRLVTSGRIYQLILSVSWSPGCILAGCSRVGSLPGCWRTGPVHTPPAGRRRLLQRFSLEGVELAWRERWCPSP